MTRENVPQDPHRSGRTLHFAVLDHDGLDLFPETIWYPEELAAYMNVTKDKSSLTKTV